MIIISFTNIVLLFVPMRCNVIAEFDVSTEENRLFDVLETKLGRGYELLGHSTCRLSH